MVASSTSWGHTPSPPSPRLPTSRYTSPCVLQRAPADPCDSTIPAWFSQRRLRWQAESYKFARLYPLRQAVRTLSTAASPAMPAALHNLPWQLRPSLGTQDVPNPLEPSGLACGAEQLAALREKEGSLPGELSVVAPARDFTPPEFLTLLFTDLGVLTPSAVSDELIKLYY